MKMHTHRIARLLIATLAVVSGMAFSLDLKRELDFQIPSQTLGSALLEFSKQAGVQVLTGGMEVSRASSRGVSGHYTLDSGLSRLLADTGYIYRVAGENTISIVPRDLTRADANNQSIQIAQTDSGQEGKQAQSQDAGVKLEEVVVTAQKRKERLLEVPISITAISGEDLDAARIRDISDLAMAVPGLSVQKNAPGQMLIAIRGINSGRGDAALTGIYLDEVPLTAAVGESLGNADLGTQDLQRVEVLKGPQGTLFGDGSVGGTVRYITRDPVLDKIEGSLTSSYYLTNGGDPSWNLRGVANFPVVDGVFAVRAVGSYDDNGGWIDKVAGPGQPVLEKNINDGKSHDFRIKALLKASDNLSITGLIGIGRFNGGANNNVNVDSLDESHFQPAADPNRDERNSYKYNVYNLTATYALGFANLMSSTSQYTTDRSNSFSQIGPLDGGFVLEVAIDRKHIEVNSFSQEFRLTSSADGPFKWTGGLFYKDTKARTDPGSGDGQVQLAIDPLFVLPPTFTPASDSTSQTKAAFGDISYQLTHRLEIGGGLRYVEDRREGYDPANKAATLTQKTYDKSTYRAFVSYKVTDDVNVYANTSTGFRAGIFNTPDGVAAGGPLLAKPEEVVAYELGAKARFFEGKLYSSISVYRNDYKDILGLVVTLDAPANTSTSYYYNPGTARVDGVEWDVEWKPTHDWALGLAGDFLHSKYTKIAADAAEHLVQVGDPIDGSPNYGFSLFTQLGINLASDARGTLRLDWDRRGRARETARDFIWLADTAESSIINLVNARFDIDWHDWTYGVFAQNLLDDRGSINASIANLQWQSRPRSFGLTATRRF